VGNDCKIRFWEDVWIGTSSLAIQYWELYCLINEHNRSIAELCNVDNLKCTFRRCVDVRLFNLWEEVVSIADEEVVSIAEPSVNFTPEKDELIWQFQSSRVYWTRSLYGVINFRGVIPVFLPAVWKLPIPPRIHFFSWLLSQNRLLTRYNLGKRRSIDDPSCLFCKEPETIFHLFLGCVIASKVWRMVSPVIGIHIGSDYESVARLWFM
jgi:hypothetical protein